MGDGEGRGRGREGGGGRGSGICGKSQEESNFVGFCIRYPITNQESSNREMNRLNNHNNIVTESKKRTF